MVAHLPVTEKVAGSTPVLLVALSSNIHRMPPFQVVMRVWNPVSVNFGAVVQWLARRPVTAEMRVRISSVPLANLVFANGVSLTRRCHVESDT